MKEWTKHWTDDGVLADAGMIPLPADEMKIMIARIQELPTLTVEELK